MEYSSLLIICSINTIKLNPLENYNLYIYIFFAFETDNQISFLVNNVIPFLERQVKMMHTHILLFTLEKNVECTIAIKLDMCTFTPF